MRLLIDENVSDAVARFFVARGHDVLLSRDWLGRMTPDYAVAFAANEQGLIVVTHDKDFRRFTRLLPAGMRTRFRTGAGRISLQCEEHRAVARLEANVRSIEFHYDLAIEKGERLIVSVTETTFAVVTLPDAPQIDDSQ